eukprot:6174356-Pleurochrysis_carterae.AAC.1
MNFTSFSFSFAVDLSPHPCHILLTTLTDSPHVQSGLPFTDTSASLCSASLSLLFARFLLSAAHACVHAHDHGGCDCAEREEDVVDGGDHSGVEGVERLRVHVRRNKADEQAREYIIN